MPTKTHKLTEPEKQERKTIVRETMIEFMDEFFGDYFHKAIKKYLDNGGANDISSAFKKKASTKIGNFFTSSKGIYFLAFIILYGLFDYKIDAAIKFLISLLM